MPTRYIYGKFHIMEFVENGKCSRNDCSEKKNEAQRESAKQNQIKNQHLNYIEFRLLFYLLWENLWHLRRFHLHIPFQCSSSNELTNDVKRRSRSIIQMLWTLRKLRMFFATNAICRYSIQIQAHRGKSSDSENSYQSRSHFVDISSSVCVCLFLDVCVIRFCSKICTNWWKNPRNPYGCERPRFPFRRPNLKTCSPI